MAGPIKIAILADARQAQATFLKVSAGADSMGAKLTRAGSKLTKSVTLPIVAIGIASVKMSTDFNSAMTKIQTQAGASAHDVQVLSKQVLALAPSTQQGPEALAEALFHLKSVGLGNVKAMQALKASSDLAALGGSNLEDTTNALAGAWRSGIKGAHDFNGAVGTLNAIVGAGNQTMQDLTDAIGTGFLPSARSFGLSLQSVGSALALMTDEGIPAQVAATRLRMSFSLLGAPTQKAAGLLSTIGLASDSLAKKMRQGGPNGGLVGAIGLLRDHLAQLNKTQQATLISGAFGGGRSSSAILTLLNNYDVLARKQKQIADTAGDVGEAIKKQAETPQAQFKRLESNVETLAIELGDVLLPDVLKLTDGLNKGFTAFAKLPKPVKETAGALALVAAAAGPLLLVSGALIRSVTAVAAGITLLGEACIGTRIQLALLSIQENKLRFGAGIVGIAAFAAATQTSNQNAKSLLNVVGGLAVGFAVGGPLGAAVGGSAAILLGWRQEVEADKKSVTDFTNAINKLGDQGQVAKLQSLSDSLSSAAGQTHGIVGDFFAKQLAIVTPALARAKKKTDNLTGAQFLNAQAAGKFGKAEQVAAKHTKAVAEAANATAQKFLTLGQDVSNAKVSLDGWIKQLAAQGKALANFADNALQASHKGLRDGLIKELDAAGPAGALRMQQLADGSKTQIARANQAFASGQRAAEDLENAMQHIESPTIDVNTSQAQSNLRNLQYQVDRLHGKTIIIRTTGGHVPGDPTSGSGGGASSGAGGGGRIRVSAPDLVIPVTRKSGGNVYNTFNVYPTPLANPADIGDAIAGALLAREQAGMV